jgi:hypothetical protein
MLAAAMTNSGAINTSGATTMQNPQRAPGWKQANHAAAQRRYAAGLTPTQMQAIQQYTAAKQQRQQAAPIQMQAANQNASLAASAYNQQGGAAAQNTNANALRGAYNQFQSGALQATPNNFGFQQQSGLSQSPYGRQPSSGLMEQNAQLEAAHRAASPQTIGLMSQAQQMGLDPYAALMNPSGFQQQYGLQQQSMNAQAGMAAMQNPYGMTMGGGGFNERGSVDTPIGMRLLQLQAPYTSQPMAYGGRSVPASAYMF